MEVRECRDPFLFLQEGRGFDEQIGAALARLQETCDGGDARSAYILGYAYVRGFGVPRDETRGESLLGLACERGMGDACQMLAALQGSASGGK
jgi:TPR repeat protein